MNNSCSPARRIPSGFTIVELIVVIAVIMLLAAFLLPALGKIKERSWDTACRAHLSDLYIATMGFARERGGSLPAAVSTEHYNPHVPSWEQHLTGWVNWDMPYPEPPVNTPQKPVMWTRWSGPTAQFSVRTGTLFPYLSKRMDSYVCPTFQHKDELNGGADAVRSYVMNKRAAHASGFTHVHHVQNPSKLLLFADMGPTKIADKVQVANVGLRDNNIDARDGRFDGDVNGTYPQEAIADYHFGKGNAVFFDGHVEALTPAQTTSRTLGNW